jgi:5-methyltetrahydrofolate--homocysteine methyltransferase
MSRFLDTLAGGQVLLMDGAMGTELQRAGLKPGECAELWNLNHADRVGAIHQAYAAAGAVCITTNTFQANSEALARHGLQDRMDDIWSAALRLARGVAGSNRFVLADVGPATAWRAPAMQQEMEHARSADAVLLETFSDMDVLWAVKHVCRPILQPNDIPILLSITYRRTPEGVITTQGGQSPEVFARLAAQYGAAALGVNCGRDIGMEETIAILRRYRALTDLPLFARPNAGTPVECEGSWVYPHSAEMMAARLPELLEIGVSMVGGCCGTTPEHIAAFRPIVARWNAAHPAQEMGL